MGPGAGPAKRNAEGKANDVGDWGHVELDVEAGIPQPELRL